MFRCCLRLVLICCIGLFCRVCFAVDIAKSASAVSLGVNFCDWQDRYGSQESLRALQDLRKVGVRDVVFIPTWYQKHGRATSISRIRKKTSADKGLMTDIRRSAQLGFDTGIKFHIDTEDNTPRSNISFQSFSDFELWWKEYRDVALHYARMAKLCNVGHYSVGCELSGVTIHPYTSHWVALIKEIRTLFGKDGPKITYSARHQNVANIGFLDKLDYIGLNAWPYFHDTGTVTVQTIRKSWRKSIYYPEAFRTSRRLKAGMSEHGHDMDFFDFIRFISRLYDKPIVLTELGCQSKQGILTKPVDWWLPGNPDVLSQAMFYRGFFEELLSDIESFRRTNPGQRYPLNSVLIWNYTLSEGGPKDSDYTFRNKPLTEAVLRKFVRDVPVQ